MGEMAIELADIVYTLDGTRIRCGTANTLAQRNANTSRLALEWSEHEVSPFEEIEAHPVDSRQLLEYQGAEIGRIRYPAVMA